MTDGPMTIAESIRRSALSYPLGYVGDVESIILHTAFMSDREWAQWAREIDGVAGRTYMLLIAQALE